MALLRTMAPVARPLLTRVPLADVPLPALPDPVTPWPGREIEVGGASLHIRETPGPADAPTAVYVHGLGGSATNWTELAAQLGAHAPGVAVDLPGFGRTKPGHRPDFTLAAQAEVVEQTLDTLDRGPVHLFGNSMGGAIALLVAARRPDLVRTLTLISPAMPDLRPDLRRMADPRLALALLPVIGPPMRRAMAGMDSQQRAEQLLQLCFAEPWRVSEDRIRMAVAEYTERLTMPWAGAALSGATLGIFRAWLTAGAQSLWSVAKRVTVPALVVWGSQDRLVTVRKAPRTASALARGRLLVLPRTGHVAQMERPATVARAALAMWQAAQRDDW